jgi:trimethylamine---corrinoid protein Co-methyltransferase
METRLTVLSSDERAQIHERTLRVLAGHGMRVDTAAGRRILAEAGALVDDATRMVRFPRPLVEQALQSATTSFTLGGRRPGWAHPLNAGAFTLLADGGATSTLDGVTGQRRPCTQRDWAAAVTILDASDDVGLYWCPTEYLFAAESPAGLVRYLAQTFGAFSKHVQDSFGVPAQAPWITEVLDIVFGGRDQVRRAHPFSFLLTPASPLTIEATFTDTWLALRGWDIPVAIMPMPLQGATAPGSRLATLLTANCETIGMLCLVQAAAAGTPVIYAPVIATMDPRTGGYAAGAVEHAVLAAAGTEMARFYGLPVEASGFCSEQREPGIRAAWEKAHSALLATLSWPDILVGPGLLGGAMVLSLEQLVLDLEVGRIARRAHEGVPVRDELWLDDVLARVGPCGSFLAERSTRQNVRGGEWPLRGAAGEDGLDAGRMAEAPNALAAAHERVGEILRTHAPLPLPEDVAAALFDLESRAAATE